MANILRNAVIGAGSPARWWWRRSAPSLAQGRRYRYASPYEYRRPRRAMPAIAATPMSPGYVARSWDYPAGLRHQRHGLFVPRSRLAAGTARYGTATLLSQPARAEPLLERGTMAAVEQTGLGPGAGCAFQLRAIGAISAPSRRAPAGRARPAE